LGGQVYLAAYIGQHPVAKVMILAMPLFVFAIWMAIIPYFHGVVGTIIATGFRWAYSMAVNVIAGVIIVNVTVHWQWWLAGLAALVIWLNYCGRARLIDRK
jgi:hypothetical protein